MSSQCFHPNSARLPEKKFKMMQDTTLRDSSFLALRLAPITEDRVGYIISASNYLQQICPVNIKSFLETIPVSKMKSIYFQAPALDYFTSQACCHSEIHKNW